MREVYLANGKGVAFVDDEDYEEVSRYRWLLHPGGYANTTISRPAGGRTTLFMHRLIMGTPPFEGAQVDHINGDKLDNRRANLRWATASQNKGNCGKHTDNSSGYKGVTWDAFSSRWKAQIWVNGRRKHLGRYNTPEEAARAYDEAAVEVFGPYAKTNF